MMNRKILVAYDGSLLSRKAIEEAKKQISLVPETEVHVVSVVENTGPQTSVMLARNITDEVVEHAHEQMGKIREEFAKERAPVVTEVLVKKGNENPGKSVCKYAKEQNMDMIIVGSRGLGNVKGMFLGSVSNEIVHYASCPVLIIK